MTIFIMDKIKAKKIFGILSKEYPQTKCFLVHKNPHQLLVATILSAQCTDKRVNIVTKTLFKKYKTIHDFADADLPEFETDIRSTGFYKNKAKNIINTSKIILEQFGGKVPKTMDELLTLSGVARKTSNIVLFHGFGKTEGVAVDTHVKRLSGRLGLSKNTDPVKIEKDLMKLFDKNNWGILTNLLIEHGRNVCDARKPLCDKCSLAKMCPSVNNVQK